MIDGSSADRFLASVLIDRERIVEVGPLLNPPDCPAIDCTGLTIAPGFIDLHSHSDLQVLEHRTEKLKQGVTTEAIGNCGFSPFPYNGDPASLQEFAAGILGKRTGWGWRSARSYFDALSSAGAANRAIPLVGHGSLRIAVHGLGQDELTARELDEMCSLLEDSLDAGCAGLSTGLMYAPGSAANKQELERVCAVVACKGKLYASHIRSYGGGLVEAVREQITVAEQTGCRLQISHLQAAGRDNWRLQETALEAIEQAHARGLDIEFDIYPYQCGSTVLTQLLPQWALDGGTPALLALLHDSQARDRLTRQLGESAADRWSDVTISSVDSAVNTRIIGQTVTQVAHDRERNAADVVLDLLAEEQGAVNIVTFNQSEANLRHLLTHELCSVITDGFYVKGNPHPRLHGAYPELLGRLVRDRKWLTLAQAIHKSTAQPAARLRLRDQGLLRPGYLADLVIFDDTAIASRSTYEEPAADPQGIAYVIKDGELLFRGDAF